MSITSFSEALRPLAARLPKVVREHEILRVAGAISGKDHAKAAEGVRREVLTWAQNRSGGRLPPEAWNSQDFEFLSGGRNSVGVRINNAHSDIWAIRADDPDKEVPGRVWTTEVVVGAMKSQTPRFSARLLVSTPEGELDVEPHTPGFVRQVVECCGLSRGEYELSLEPWTIASNDDAERLADLLVDPERTLPFFVLSVPENADRPDRPFFDPVGLVRATIGTAQVVVVPSTYTWALTDRFGKLRSVYGGAVRAYLGGFSEDADPYAHRLVLPEIVSTPDGAARSQRWMRWLAATESIRHIRMGKEILAFAAIRSASLTSKQRQLETEGASDSDQLAAAKARIDALEGEVAVERTLQGQFSEEHAAAEDRALAAEAQVRASAFRIQQLLGQIRERGDGPDTNIVLPGAWSEFASWCDTNLAGRAVLSSRARSDVRAPEFDDVALAARCLLWLANEGRDRRINGGEGSLADLAIEDGIRHAHCGGDEFDIDWRGQRHTVDWHVKNGGNTRDPRRCLRIYYFWDPASQQIVVAEMPAHRRTSAT